LLYSSVPICKTFNQSLAACIFPYEWKNSFTTPVYKSGNNDLVINMANNKIICFTQTLGKMNGAFIIIHFQQFPATWQPFK